jgi:YD repeat-containing protein
LTDGRSLATSFTLDTAGRPTQIQTADGATQSWTRDFAGKPTTYTDARNEVTTYLNSYGADKGDVLKVTFPDGTTAAYTYQATFHKPTQITDQLGNLTTLGYDAGTGDLLTIKNALGQVVTFTWSGGLKQSITNPLGKTVNFQYDATRRLQVTIDELSNRTTLGYDAAGNVSTVKDALGNVRHRGYRCQQQPHYPAVRRAESVHRHHRRQQWAHHAAAGRRRAGKG